MTKEGGQDAEPGDGGEVSASSIVRAFELSPLQEGLLYHTLRDPSSGVYRAQCVADLEGQLDHTLFREAWGLVAERHETFRTFFAWERRERPLQVVRDRVDLDMRFLDWTKLDPATRGDRWSAVLERDRNASFDLTRAPLMRFVVVRLGPEVHRLLWAVHHAVLDAWSAQVVFEEVLEGYDALVGDRSVDRAPAPSYAQFVGWLQTRDAESAETHWRQALAGFKTPTPLPRVGQGQSSSERRVVDLELSAAETAECRAMAAHARITANTAVVGAWVLLLSRHARTDDVLCGVTVSERPSAIPGVQQAAGLYLSTLPVRVRIPREEGCAVWLRELQNELAEGRAHSAPGLAEIRRWAEVEGDGLFDSLVVFEGLPAQGGHPTAERALRARGLSVSVPTNLPLALLAYPGDRLRLALEYDPASTTSEHGLELLREVADLLLEFGRAPKRALSGFVDASTDRVPLPSVQESGVGRGGPSTTDPGRRTETQAAYTDIAEMIAARVAEHPDRIALWSTGGRVSYAELERVANRLAHRISSSLGRSGGLVGVVGTHQPESVIAMLATLKAGCAYVPIDPRLPAGRLKTMVAATDVVVAPGENATLMVDIGGTLLPLEDDTAGLATEGGTGAEGPDSLPEPTPDSVAYVIFTSGSTGEPKGVVVERAQLTVSTRARFDYYDDHPDAFLLLSSLSVDSSIAGVYWSLCAGGTLVMPGLHAEQDLDRLATLIEEAGVTHTLLLPSLYRELLENIDATRLRTLRTVIVAGEACPPAVVRMHVEKLPDARLHNEYGPSEATVWATVDDMSAAPAGPVTIGRPVSSARIYIMGSDGEPLAAGEAGEIVIGGPCVARGYLGRPDLTVERFTPDPRDPGRRLYKTGDRGRYLADGRLEFLGRLDDQVKVRGFRVETQEIEHALEAHPGINEAIVVLAPLTTARTIDPDGVEGLATALLARSEDEIETLLRAVESST